MTPRTPLLAACLLALLAPPAQFPARAADVPASRQADWTAAAFRFHSGETMDLRIHYVTLGEPSGEPVLVLHGTGGTGTGMVSPAFAGELFGPGQPLDARTHFIILPDAIGAGGSSKPSDGMRARFPHYDYADMVEAQYRLLTEALGIRRLRLVLGNSMGGMEAWVWGTAHPGFADALVPMASQPSAMAARNWMMRRLLIESIRQDPAYAGGDYTAQPPSLRLANAMFGIATNGGTLNYQAQGATHARADDLVDAALSVPPPTDANDFIWQWDASADYDPAPLLDRVTVPVLAINSADDERNPPETGVTAAALARLPHGELFLIPASAETRGHGTTGFARFWAVRLGTFLAGVPKRPS